MAQTKTMLTGCLLGVVALWAGAARSADGGVPLSHFDVDVADKQLDPCADFYQYTCSRWMAANPIPADEVARLAARHAAGSVPALAKLLGLRIPPPPPRRLVTEHRLSSTGG